MGNHISTFKETEEQSKSHTRLDTSQSDWITSHADLSGCKYYIKNIDAAIEVLHFLFSFIISGRC